MQKIAEISCATVSEFWEYLSPDKYRQPNIQDTLFRGQADSDWGLIPSVLREKRNTPRRAEDQVFYESMAIADFIKYCDMAKLPLPNDSIEFREKAIWIQDEFARIPSKWPPTDYCYILALMQHFGVKTRLLDWSMQPLVAAYFAAKQLLEKFFEWQNILDAKRIAVWILRPRLLRSHGVEVLNIPPSNNRNMYAQSGRFTLLRQRGMRGRPFEGTGCLKEFIEAENIHVSLEKVTLPAMLAVDLLEKCDSFGINDATNFPDYSGVFEALKTSQLLFDVKRIIKPEECGIPL